MSKTRSKFTNFDDQVDFDSRSAAKQALHDASVRKQQQPSHKASFGKQSQKSSFQDSLFSHEQPQQQKQQARFKQPKQQPNQQQFSKKRAGGVRTHGQKVTAMHSNGPLFPQLPFTVEQLVACKKRLRHVSCPDRSFYFNPDIRKKKSITKGKLMHVPVQQRIFGQIPSLAATTPGNENVEVEPQFDEFDVLAQKYKNHKMLRKRLLKMAPESKLYHNVFNDGNPSRFSEPRNRARMMFRDAGFTAKQGKGGKFTWGDHESEIQSMMQQIANVKHAARVVEEQKFMGMKPAKSNIVLDASTRPSNYLMQHYHVPHTNKRVYVPFKDVHNPATEIMRKYAVPYEEAKQYIKK